VVLLERFDVVVVGGGPAGLSSAWHLASRGFGVVVVDDRVPVNSGTLCGVYVPLSVFEEFGLPRRLGVYGVGGVVIVSRGGVWDVDLGGVVGYNVDRDRLASFLADGIRDEGGVVVEGCRVGGFEVSDRGVVVRGCGRVFGGRVLVGADGAYSKIGAYVRGRFRRDELGLAAQVRVSSTKRFGERVRNRNVIFLGGEFSPFGYGWIFPKRDVLDVGVGSLASRTTGSGLVGYVGRVAGFFGLKVEGRVGFAPVPLCGPKSRVARGRVLVVGDAAGHVSPLTGEGVRFALEAGRFAAESIAEYLSGRTSLSGMGRRYLWRLWRGFYRRLWLERRLLDVFSGGHVASSSLVLDEKFRRIVAGLYTDSVDVYWAVLKGAWRLVVSKLVG